MKKGVFVLILVLLFAMLAVAASADMTGWKIVFNLNGQTCEVGANDYGSGWAVVINKQEYAGTHIGVGGDGLLEGVINYGAKQPFSETITFWNDATTDTNATLSWQWQNYDRLWNTYFDEVQPANLDINLAWIPRGGRVNLLNPNSGSLNLNLGNSSAFTGQRLVLTSSPTPSSVPEPSSLVGLGTGMMIWLAGVIRRRRLS